jgi:membrane protease YdiL (CAAX protease family)
MIPRRLGFSARSLALVALWSVGLVISIAAVPFILQAAIHLFSITTTVNAPVLLLTLGLVGSLLMGILFVLFAWLMKRPITKADVGLSRPLSWKDIGIAIAGFVIYAIASSVAMYIFQRLGGNVSEAQEFGLGSLFGGERLYAMLIFVGLVPIIEEIIFRGILYSKLRASGAHMIVSSVVVSALFGLAHGQWNVAVDVFVMSMVACYLREYTGVIWPGIIIHMIKNFIGFYITFVLLQGVS